MKKPRQGYFELTDPIYEPKVIINFRIPRSDLYKMLSDKYDINESAFKDLEEDGDDGNNAEVFTLKHSTTGAAIFCLCFWEDIDVGLIMHESLHLIHAILRDRGIEFTEESEEAFAYYLGYYGGSIYTEINKRFKKL